MPKLSITCANAVYHRLVSDAQTEGKVLHLNHECHAIIEKRITIPSRHLPSLPMVSHHKRHQRIYVNVANQLMDNFYVLSGILIKKCPF